MTLELDHVEISMLTALFLFQLIPSCHLALVMFVMMWALVDPFMIFTMPLPSPFVIIYWDRSTVFGRRLVLQFSSCCQQWQ